MLFVSLHFLFFLKVRGGKSDRSHPRRAEPPPQFNLPTSASGTAPHCTQLRGHPFSGEGTNSYGHHFTRSTHNLFDPSATRASWLLAGSLHKGRKQYRPQERGRGLGDWSWSLTTASPCILISRFDSLLPIIVVINNKRCWGTFYKCVCLIILISERSLVDKKGCYLHFTEATWTLCTGLHRMTAAMQGPRSSVQTSHCAKLRG